MLLLDLYYFYPLSNRVLTGFWMAYQWLLADFSLLWGRLSEGSTLHKITYTTPLRKVQFMIYDVISCTFVLD